MNAGLQLVTAVAAATVSRNAGVSITLERHGQLVTVAASADRVVAVDQHQYDTRQGPCLDAKTYGRRFYVESVAEETRWPAFTPLALQHGIGSIFSSPLRTRERSQGSLNVYAGVERAFGGAEQELAAECAEHASHILSTAAGGASDQDWNERFAGALGARRTIHQAQGFIMARQDISAHDALARIMQTARTRGVTALAYASEIVNARQNPGPTESDQASP